MSYFELEDPPLVLAEVSGLEAEEKLMEVLEFLLEAAAEEERLKFFETKETLKGEG